MTVKETSHEIDEAARQWLARLDRGDADPQALQQFETWLAADRRHRGAYLRASAAWNTLNRGRALAQLTSSELVRGGYLEHKLIASTSLTRRALLGGATAAAACALLGVWAWNRRQYSTQVGEIRRFALPDGTLAVLSTGSKIAVHFTEDLRSVELQDGEVWFDVAKDAARPFVVAAERLTVRAVGTAFSVQRLSAEEAVLVTEGVVEAWNAKIKDPIVRRLPSGSRGVLQDQRELTVQTTPPNTIRKQLAWREGSIELDGETVAEAAAEFNRFNNLKLVVDDAEIGSQRVVGRFNALDSAAFADSVCASFNARSQLLGKEIHLRSIREAT